MAVIYPNPCYNEVCFKGTALQHSSFFPKSQQRVRSSCSSNLIGCCFGWYFTCEKIDSSYQLSDQLMFLLQSR